MSWIAFKSKQFLSRDAINLDHIERFGAKGNVVIFETAKWQYELHYSDDTEALETYGRILAAINNDRAVTTIADPEQTWKEAIVHEAPY